MHEHLFLAIRGLQAQRIFRLGEGPAIVGRHPECDLQLVDSTVSRRHAEFVYSGRKFFVLDLGSMNGTFVNDCRVEASNEVRVRDHLKFGNVGCQFFESEKLAISALEAGPEESTKSGAGTLEHHLRGLGQLTRTQRTVVNQLVSGMAEKDIADILGKSPDTVHTHMKNIYKILHVHSLAQLLALLHGKLQRPPESDETLGAQPPP